MRTATDRGPTLYELEMYGCAASSSTISFGLSSDVSTTRFQIDDVGSSKLSASQYALNIAKMSAPPVDAPLKWSASEREPLPRSGSPSVPCQVQSAPHPMLLAITGWALRKAIIIRKKRRTSALVSM